MTETRHEKGLKLFTELFDPMGANALEEIGKISPVMAAWMIDFPYGEVLSRPELDLRTRQLATVAALTALGTAETQLKGHILGALNVGCSPKEIVEVILQMAVYAGFPAALNGLTIAQEVFTAKSVNATDES
jgi:4-carboxymuconolactone decarboxylase